MPTTGISTPLLSRFLGIIYGSIPFSSGANIVFFVFIIFSLADNGSFNVLKVALNP
jgi:hypothetical protein